MSDGDELLGKADALLSRYRLAPAREEAPLPDLPDFPVLTDVVEVEDSPSAVATAAEPSEDAASTPERNLDRELQQLEAQIRERVLLAIEPYVASFLGEPLEARIRAHLAAALDRLAEETAAMARQEASELVNKAVSAAVEREIAALRSRLGG